MGCGLRTLLVKKRSGKVERNRERCVDPGRPVRGRSVRGSTAAKEFWGGTRRRGRGRKQQLTTSRGLAHLPAPSEGGPARRLCSQPGRSSAHHGRREDGPAGPRAGQRSGRARHSPQRRTFRFQTCPEVTDRAGVAPPGSVPCAVARPHAPPRRAFCMSGRGGGSLSESQCGSGVCAGKPCPVMGRV